MHHLAAFFGAQAASGTNVALAAAQDNAFTIMNSKLVMPMRMQIRREYLMGLGVTEGRVNVPSFRIITYPRIYPTDKAAAPSSDPAVVRLDDNGPILLNTEGLGIDTTTDATAGPNNTMGLLWLYPTFRAAMPGQAFTMKATSTTVAAAGAWTGGSITLEDNLPTGRYEVIGMEAWGTNVGAVRLRFPGQGLLPGVLAQQAAGEFLTDHQRMGRMGAFGQFDNQQVPTIEVFGLGATSAITIYLDLIKVG